MKQIPQSTKVRYEVLLAQHQFPKNLHSHYLKWLRYYLDFCRKYNFKESDTKSLPPFIEKLKVKKQTDQQQNQAFNAISMKKIMGRRSSQIFTDKYGFNLGIQEFRY